MHPVVQFLVVYTLISFAAVFGFVIGRYTNLPPPWKYGE